MELTASCEGGHKWTGRPPTPVFRAPSEHVSATDAQTPHHFQVLNLTIPVSTNCYPNAFNISLQKKVIKLGCILRSQPPLRICVEALYISEILNRILLRFQSKLEDNLPEPQSIYLEGALAHESQILVADSQIKREEVYDSELNGSAEEPAV